MRIKLLVVLLFLLLVISACGTQAPGETTAPTVAETQTPTATKTPTETPFVEPSITPTSIPTNAPDCTNSAVFVTDVTIPDNSSISSNTTFTKTWRVKNTGTCIWGPDYKLSYYSEEQMGLPTSVPLSVVFPNQTVDLTMNLRASTSVGTHRSNFVIKNPAGGIIKIDNDSRLWVIINVLNEVASVPTAAQGAESIPVTGSENGSGFASVTCAYTVDAAKVTEAINALNGYRVENGLPVYTVNEMLTKAAVAQANDMACNKLFGHNGSNGSTPTTRVAASGYVASSATENVYGSYPPLSGQGAIDWWKNDKTDIRHNQNLLSTTYTEIGAAYSFFNNFGYYVLVFATPK